MINIVYLENGLNPQLRKEVTVESTSIREVAPDWSIPYVAFLDGKAILRKDWDIVLEDTHSLAFIEANAIPQGGGGGTDPLRTVLMIAVLVVAPEMGALLGPSLTGAGVLGLSAAQWTVGITLAGMALVNAIVPVKPLSSQQQAELATPSPTYSVQAQGNVARLNSAIPEHFGRLRAYPDFAAQPYTEYQDNEQYAYQLLCLGRGEYSVADIKIEDTPISNFNDVEVTIVPPYTPVTQFPTRVTNSLEVSGQEVRSFKASYSYDSTKSTLVTITLTSHGLSLGDTIHVTVKSSDADPGTFLKDVVVSSIIDLDKFTIQGNTSIPKASTGIMLIHHIVGPFIANMPTTPTNLLKVDFIAPKGLYHANDDGSLSKVTVYPVVEVREVDDYGNYVAGSSWKSPTSSLIDLGWADWVPQSSSTKFPTNIPANTSLVEYKITASYPCSYEYESGGHEGHTVYSSTNVNRILVTQEVTLDNASNLMIFMGLYNTVRVTYIGPITYYIERRDKRTISATSKEAATTTPQRWTLQFYVPSGRYACRVYRTGISAASTEARTADTFAWSSLKAYHPESEFVTTTRSNNIVTVYYENHGYDIGSLAHIGFLPNYSGGDWEDVNTAPMVHPFTVINVIDDNTFTVNYSQYINMPIHDGYAYLYKDHGDVTLLAIKMRASNNLSVQAARKINVLATRKLPVWSRDSNGKIQWSSIKVESRDVSDAIIYTAKQIGMSDSQIDFEGISYISRGRRISASEYFDGRFDNFVSFWEAVTKQAAVIRCKPFLQAGILRIIRDELADIPTALFTQRNIIKNSLSINYLLPTEDSAKKVGVKYFDNVNWQPATVYAYLGTKDPKTTPAIIDMFGITDRYHAYKEGLYQVATNLYRRKIIKFQTEMEGFIPTFGDLILIQHDMPAWGQSGEIVAWNHSTNTLTLSEKPVWSEGKKHYIALRDINGSVQGSDAYLVTQDENDPYKVIIGTSKEQHLEYTGTPYFGTNMERTHYTFGPSEAWRQPAKVLSVKPQSFSVVEIECINEDPAVHTIQQNSPPLAPTVYNNLKESIAAPVITAVSVNRLIYYPDKISISWSPAQWADHYIVELQDKDGRWGISQVRTTDTSTRMTVELDYSNKVRVAAQSSTSLGPWYVADIPAIVRPEIPTEFIYTVNRSGILFKWPAVAAYNLVTYELRIGETWDTGTVLVKTATTEYLVEKYTPDVYHVMLKSIDSKGNYSADTFSLVVDVKPPENYDVFNITFDTVNKRLFNFNYLNTPKPVDLAGAVIRFTHGTYTNIPPKWEDLTPWNDGIITSSFESSLGLPGDYVFAIKAVDLAGNESTTAKYINITLPKLLTEVSSITPDPTWVNTNITVNPDGSLNNAGTGAPILSEISGSIGHAQFKDDYFIINIDDTDVDVELRFGRKTGGPASITWNGSLMQVSKPLKPVELGVNNISATEPEHPFAGQIWISPT